MIPPRTLRLASLRSHAKHPWQFGLCLAGIALGIAAVVAIDLALVQAERSFARSVSGVIGNATHQITAGTAGFDELLYRDLRLGARLRSIAPVVEGEVRVLPPPGLTDEELARSPLADRPVRTLLGIDLYAEASFRPVAAGRGEGDIAELVSQPGSVALERSAAEALGLSLGDRFDIAVGARRVSLSVAGIWSAADDLTRRGAATLIVCDLATAQEALARPGLLDRIDVRLDLPHSPTEVTLRELLPDGVDLRPAQERTKSFEGMTRAFRFNLQALGLLSLVVGVFLIHHSMTVSVLGRRALWGRLRASGVTRREILTLVLGEAALLGLIGGALGVALGLALSQGVVGVVEQTIEDLYATLGEEESAIPWRELGKALLLGIVASLLSALAPALEASRSELRPVLQRSALEKQTRRQSFRCAGIATGLFVLSPLCLELPTPTETSKLIFGYGALVCLLLGFALIAPLLTRAVVSLLSRITSPFSSWVARHAIRGITRQLSRTGLAIAALSIAVSMSIGVATMVQSFRTTLQAWLSETLPADVYLSAPGAVARHGMRFPLPEAVDRACLEHPGSELVIRNRWVELPAQGVSGIGPDVRVAVLSPHTPEELGIPLDAPVDLESWRSGDPPTLLVSEPFSRKSGLGRGDSLELRTARGLVRFSILGVFRDYSSDLGYVAVSRSVFERYHSVPGSTSIAIYLKDGVDPEQTADELRTALAGSPGLLVRPTADLRAATLEIFDRTFLITEVIRQLAIAVAAVGVFGALVTLELERRREVAILRAAGLTGREWMRLVIVQTTLIGAIAGVIAIPLGVASAALLTVIVNQRSFGWSIDLHLSAAPLFTGVAVAAGAAFLAGLLPAWRLGKSSIPDGLREMET